MSTQVWRDVLLTITTRDKDTIDVAPVNRLGVAARQVRYVWVYMYVCMFRYICSNDVLVVCTLGRCVEPVYLCKCMHMYVRRHIYAMYVCVYVCVCMYTCIHIYHPAVGILYQHIYMYVYM